MLFPFVSFCVLVLAQVGADALECCAMAADGRAEFFDLGVQSLDLGLETANARVAVFGALAL